MMEGKELKKNGTWRPLGGKGVLASISQAYGLINSWKIMLSYKRQTFSWLNLGWFTNPFLLVVAKAGA